MSAPIDPPRSRRFSSPSTGSQARLGELLLMDALARALRIYTKAGGIGLFVDALDAQAAGYYRRFGFEVSPDSPLLLFLSAKVTS